MHTGLHLYAAMLATHILQHCYFDRTAIWQKFVFKRVASHSMQKANFTHYSILQCLPSASVINLRCMLEDKLQQSKLILNNATFSAKNIHFKSYKKKTSQLTTQWLDCSLCTWHKLHCHICVHVLTWGSPFTQEHFMQAKLT